MYLFRAIQRGKSSIFGWGYNKHNCGYPINNETKGETPFQVMNEIDVKRVSSGYSETLMLSSNGDVYSYGHNGLIGDNKQTPLKISFD